MGNSTSRVVGCFVPAGNGKDGVNLEFLEPLDEGLGHSFCYVRPVIADSPAITPSNSERFTVDSSTFDSEGHSGSFRQEIVEDLAGGGLQRPNKAFSETTFKTISGASVSANASTARTGNPNVLFFPDAQEPAASFESTASFAAIPLQPVPRGSGPLNGFLSGPLERGFASGPLERGTGFMSGPLEKGVFLSGPLDGADRSNFSAPLSYSQRRAGFGHLVRNMSRPMRNALARTFTRRFHGSSWMQRFLLHPIAKFGWHPKEANFQPDTVLNCGEVGPSEPEYCDARNLQWAHGKAGEDRVHVVLSEEQGWLFVGIYDGFSGPDAPDFLMSNLYKAIDKELQGLLWDYDEKPGRSAPSSGLLESDTGNASTHCVKEEFVIAQLSSDVSKMQHEDSQTSNNCFDSLDDGIVPVQFKDENSEELHTVDNVLNDESVFLDEIVEKVGDKDKDHVLIFNEVCQREGDKIEEAKDGGKGMQLASEVTKDANGNLSSRNKGDTDHAELLENEASSILETKVEKPFRKSRRLYELLQMELTGDYDVKDSQFQSVLGRKLASSSDLQPVISEDMCMRESLSAADLVSCSSSIKGDGSCCTEQAGSSRENEGVPGQECNGSKHRSMSYCSVLGQKQLIRRSFIGSRLRRMYRKQKSLRKKLFPWSYDWHRDQPHADESIVNQSVVIRRCKSGPVDHDAVLKAMSRALESTEAAYMEMVERALDKNPELALMGSCVLVMLMKDQDVYVMNLGDSRAILAQDRLNDRQMNPGLAKDDARYRNRSRESLVRVELDRISEESPMHNPNRRLCNVNKNREISICRLKMRAVQLSTDHSTSIEEEVLRIKAEHVDDIQAILNDRVKGQLKVTRAFGAGFLKKLKFNEALLEMFQINYVGTAPYVSCIPSVMHHRLCSNDRFLVLSSDGLYQYFSNEEVVLRVAWFMENVPEGDPAQDLIAELLFRAAKKNGMDFHELLDIPHGDRRKYHDDVSVMVISLEGRIWRSSG